MISGPKPVDLSEDWKEARGDYDAMRESTFVRRRLGLAPGGGSADYHIRNERQYLDFIEKSRDMSRNDNVVGKTIQKAATNCVQDGFTLCPGVGDPSIDTDLADRWKDWSEDPEQCDIQGESTFHEMENLAVESELRDGDILSIGTDEGSLQMIEGHLCRNPYAFRKKKINAVIGVELNSRRKALAYHIRQESTDPHRSSQNEKSKRYPARDKHGHRQVFHFHVKDRVSSTRGVTCLAPVFQIAGMFEDVNFAKVVQAQVVSCFAIMRYADAASSDLPTMDSKYGTPQTNPVDGRITDKLKPGAEVRANPGERIEGFSPNVPNAEYFEHARMLLMMIGINVGVPYVEMMMDASETNFSGYRGALATARRNFRRTQIALKERFHEPTYRWKVRQWLADDSALRRAAKKSGINILAHQWRPPSWPYIQPVEDAAGQLLRVRNGLISPRRLHSELSQKWEEIATETVADNSFAIRLAMEESAKIAEKFPDQQPVHWRELLSLPTPDGVQVAMPVAIGNGQNTGANNAA